MEATEALTENAINDENENHDDDNSHATQPNSQAATHITVLKQTDINLEKLALDTSGSSKSGPIAESDIPSNMELIQGKGDKHLTQSTNTPSKQIKTREVIEETKMMADIAKLNSLSIRSNKFKALLALPNCDLEQLRKLSWAGIPDEIRPTIWKLMMVLLFFITGIIILIKVNYLLIKGVSSCKFGPP